MAILQVTTGQTNVASTAVTRVLHTPSSVYGLPSGINPVRLSVFEVPPYVMRTGWPTKKPAHAIEASTLVSATGEVLADRQSPRSVAPASDYRWLADAETYDEINLAWFSWVGTHSMQITVDHAPTLIEDFSWQVGSEVFNGPSVYFNDETAQHISLDLPQPFSAYTVILVAGLNQVGNDTSLPQAGIWCSETSGGRGANLTLMGNYLYLNGQRTVPVTDHLTSSAPCYIALVAQAPQGAVYAGGGPASMRSLKVPTYAEVADFDASVVIGKTPDVLDYPVQMALFETNLYGRALTSEEIVAEVATLSRSYGGS